MIPIRLVEEIIKNPELKIVVASFPRTFDYSDIPEFVEFDPNKSLRVYTLDSSNYDKQYGIIFSIFDATEKAAQDIRYHETLFKTFCDTIKCPRTLAYSMADFYFTSDVVKTHKAQQYDDYKNSATSPYFDEIHKQILPDVLDFYKN